MGGEPVAAVTDMSDGLSPRGRGNPSLLDSMKALLRSIPAWAGEPGRDHE